MPGVRRKDNRLNFNSPGVRLGTSAEKPAEKKPKKEKKAKKEQ